MAELFVNAPIQNGYFELDDAPHKLVGIRLAQALNDLAGNSPAPHLWNLVRLAGDDEYRDAVADGCSDTRRGFEHKKITNRYESSASVQIPDSNPGYVTDADPQTSDLALVIIEEGLRDGKLEIQPEKKPICVSCGHDTGSSQVCASCGSERIGAEVQDTLLATRDNTVPVVTKDDMYGSFKPTYVDAMARHVPNPLPLSKKRKLGIDLSVFGLDGQVLDPRASLHVTALAVGELQGQDTVMLTTASVAIKSLAYGQNFRKGPSTSLRYGLYGRVPFNEMSEDPNTRDSPELEAVFRDWFLPLNALTTREAIPHNQVLALRKHFGKLAAANGDLSVTGDVAAQVHAGSLRWITDKRLISGVIPEVQ